MLRILLNTLLLTTTGYAAINSQYFLKFSSQKMVGGLLASLTSNRLIECASRCLANTSCQAYHWRRTVTSNNCDLLKYIDDYDSYTGTATGTDDCGVTGVELLCRTPEGNITSPITFDMNYTDGVKRKTATCTAGNFVNKFSSHMGPIRGADDDDGLNNLHLMCTDSFKLMSHDVGQVGTWAGWRSCLPGTFICGMKLRYEALGASSDNSCINEFIALCCFP
ncbi:putative Vitelline membrane outer layer protein 1-like 9 [Homarus americanus]|uniref:Putative Vitelline membrane outer layer protein 1-like 9 n=1 Tax=Homarus americanus TaxID=6706 RepID=A0A8J5T5H5_HOMAM|nr:putative Vitelline membrane outer layer protein 1-like 9 [Homarus americanus]